MLPCLLKTIPRAARISGQYHVALTDAELAAEHISQLFKYPGRKYTQWCVKIENYMQNFPVSR